MRLKNKTALITGAAGGIGYAFAKCFVKQGAKVAIADVNFAQAKKSASAIGALALAMDVTDQQSIACGVDQTIDAFGHINILINSAAVFTAAPIVEIDRADYKQVFDINVSGTLFVLQAVAKHMIKSGKGGKIINMASQAGRRGEPLVGLYCATKAAVISLTQSAGLDLIQYGINVNAIAPGVVDGAHWDGVDRFFAKYEQKPIGQKKKEVSDAVPFGRMGTAEDLTGMAVYLASDESDYVVAQCFGVDGGNWLA